MSPAMIRAVLIALAVILLVAIGAGAMRSCDKRHSQAAQGRVNEEQGSAFQNSAGDAISTTANVGANETASADLTRDNSEQIHAAPGAYQHVNSGVDAAGRAALCRRQAYANDPRCHPRP